MTRSIYDFMSEHPITTLFITWSVCESVVKFTKILFNRNILDLENKIQIIENRVLKIEDSNKSKITNIYHTKSE
jgi:hypothetical protein